MKVLVIIGHSDEASLVHSLAQSYIAGANKNHEVKVIDLAKLDFNPILKKGYRVIQELEPDLVRAQEDIEWADHMVFVFPIWWSLYPAILKGFIDRVFLPSFAFKYVEGKTFPVGLLKGRTAEIITTSDAPGLYRIFLRDPAINALKRDTLKFCGIKVKKVTRFGSVEKQNKETIVKWNEALRVRALALR